jgi:hypothetical protein
MLDPLAQRLWRVPSAPPIGGEDDVAARAEGPHVAEAHRLEVSPQIVVRQPVAADVHAAEKCCV